MTEQRPIQSTPVGAFRFNTDTAKLEYYDGNQFVNITTDSDEQHTGGSRMVMGGGIGVSSGNHMIFTEVSTGGSTTNFGNFAAGSSTHSMQSGSSRTRGIFSGGYRNNIEFITIASTGNGTDFGDLINHSSNTSQGYASNSTRMLTFGGYNYTAPSWAGTNAITKIEINHLGNNQDFGDMTVVDWFLAGAASPTRAVFGNSDVDIQYVTISTLGNSTIGGTIPNSIRYSAHSNAVRAVFAGTNSYPDTWSVNIASLGNAVDFGDMTSARNYNCSSGSATRGIIAGGYVSSSSNIMESYEIATSGSHVDFGDLQEARARQAALSNGHGGLG
jgi:hypothetical protein